MSNTQQAAPRPSGGPGHAARGRWVIWLVVSVFVWLPVTAGAQEDADETELERIKRDQSRVGLRIESLREKMERLASRYEDEGRTRNATLLREAISLFDERDLMGMSREVARGLELEMLGTVENQDDVITALRTVLSVLKDRRDVERLAEQADLARLGVEELGFLAENQRRLLADTRALTDRPGELSEQALDAAERMERDTRATEAAMDTQEQSSEALGLADVAGALAREERRLAAGDAPTAERQALLEGVLAGLRRDLDGTLETLSPELRAAAEEARAEALDAASRAAEAMGQARELLEAREQPGSASGAEGSGSEVEPDSPDSPSGEASGDAPAGAGTGSQGEGDASSRPDSASGGSTEGAPGEEAGSESQPGGAGEPTEGGAEPSEAAEAAGTAGESAADPSASSSEGSSSEGSAGASQAPSGDSPQPGGKPEDDTDSTEQETGAELAQAREHMEQAAQALDDMQAALEQSERSVAAARNRARAMARASARDAAEEASQLEDLVQRLEAADPEVGPELLDRTRELLRELQQRREALDSDDLASAASGGPADLASLMEMLRAQAERAQEAEAEADPEATQEQLDKLAQRQDDLRERTRQLMARLEELPDQRFQQPMERAGSSMQQASDSLRSGDTQEAPVREEEAAEALEEAQSQLQGDKEQYEQLRQDEMLFRLGDELNGLLTRQQEASRETREIEQGRADRDRLGRRERRAVARLAGTERDLSADAGSMHDAIAEDGAISFTFALARIRDDLDYVADLLGSRETGAVVRRVQESIEGSVEDLLAVLEEEMERRHEAMASAEEAEADGQQQSQQGPPPLVPPVAELLLVKSMEERQLARLQTWVQLNPDLAEAEAWTDLELDLLERWAMEHSRVSELFEQISPEPAEEEVTGLHPDVVPEGAGPDGGQEDPR